MPTFHRITRKLGNAPVLAFILTIITVSTLTSPADVIYRETFGIAPGATADEFATVFDWQRFDNNGAEITTSGTSAGVNFTVNGRPVDVANVNAGPNNDGTTGAYTNGILYMGTTPSPSLAFTSEYVVDPAKYVPGSIVFNWYEGNNTAPHFFRLLIREGGAWYASTTTFATPATPLATFGTQAQLKTLTYDPAATNWLTVNFNGDYVVGATPGSGVTTDSTAGALALGSSPASNLSGPITAFGVYGENGGTATGNRRIDSFTIEATPAVPTAPTSVVGYFKFDDFPGDNGVFTDDAGKGLRGTLGFPFSLPRSIAGPSGQAGDLALSFDGSGALAADDSAAAILNIVNPPVTMECWVRSTNDTQVGRFRAFASYGIPGGPPREGLVRGGYSFGLDPTGNLRFTLYAVADVLSGVPFPFDGQWHHVATVYSIADGVVRFYLDGAEVASVPQTGNIVPPGTRHLDIGAFFTGLGRFDGDLDRVRISKAALSPDQLDSVAGAVKAVGNDTAVSYNFNEANPPYQGEGMAPAGMAIPTAQWVLTHPPRIGASAGGPNASAAGPAKVTDTPARVATDFALEFGQGALNRSDMATVWDTNGVLNLNGDWTLEAWVKINPAAEGDRDVIFYYGHQAHGYSLSVFKDPAGSGNYKLQVTTLGLNDLPDTNTTAVVQVDAWQHVAVVHKKGQSMTYFINGIEAAIRPYTRGTTLAETNKVLYIGSEWNGDLPFTGIIDRIRISNSALTVDQLDSDAKNPAPSPSAGLQIAIALSQSNVILSWPETGSAAYILEFSDILPNANWSPEPSTPVVAAGRKTVTVPATASTRYYRLRRP